MTPERWKQVSEIFHAAIARDPASRDAFLEESCRDDPTLRAEVDAILAAHGEAGSFGESAVGMAPLVSGSRIGPYQVTELIGAGGMGEVYRARDTKLGRDVAIKILPPHLTASADRRARFEREARVLATLNHPHIAQIYGFEERGDLSALVMELVPGRTLQEILEARAPRPEARGLSEVLSIARQIAEALEAAHEKAIVHRDLKPANIKVTQDGTVKVLDFGLARIFEGDGQTPGLTAITAEDTRGGAILGTPAYMSPEQARGKPVDKRTDIWAFGCVLYELLTGRRAFEGDTMSDTIAAVLEREPALSELPATTPDGVRRVVRRCLEKDPRQRLHDIADARLELDEVQRSAATVDPLIVTAMARRERVAWILAAVLAVSLFATVLFYRPSTVGPLEFPISPPAEWSITEGNLAPIFEISPDGQQVAVVTTSGDTSILWVRPIASPAWRQLFGTQGAMAPFWAPDSQSIGFFADRKLKTVKVAGGSPSFVCDVPGQRTPSGAWSRRGVILFSGSDALRKVAEKGGDSTPATQLGQQETVHRSPSFLSDGDHYLYLAQTQTTSQLRVGSLASAETTSLGEFESNATFGSGYLLFVRSGRLMAQPFDTNSRQVKGEPLTVAEDVAVVAPWQRGQFSVSTTGRLAYSHAGIPLSQLTWVDRTGRPVGTAGDPGYYFHLNLSRDDRRVVVSQRTQPTGQPSNVDIWLVDLARAGAATRLTFDAAMEVDPTWSPDESQISFTSNKIRGKFGLFRRSSSGSGDDEPLVEADSTISAPEWSPDGRFLMYTEIGAGTQNDLWTVAPSGDRRPAVFLKTQSSEASGTFSPPEGRWVAYESDLSGRSEIYIRPFPEADKLYPISRDGGRAPRWRGDGRELFFLALDGRLMAARIETAKGLTATVPEPLFPTELNRTAPFNMHPYAVTKDGQRFLMPVVRNQPSSAPITVVLDWPATLRR